MEPGPGRGMMTLKQFIEVQEDDMPDEILMKRYAEYKENYTKRQIGGFFEEHVGDAWYDGGLLGWQLVCAVCWFVNLPPRHFLGLTRKMLRLR